MRQISIIRQLLAAQHLHSASAIGEAAVAAAAVNGLCQIPQRGLQAAAQQESSEASTPSDAQPSASHRHLQEQGNEQQGWMPPRALPPPSSTYGLKITIKAHDLIFVKMASTAIRDLVLVNFAPKSKDVLPELWRHEGSGVPWVNLAMPVGDRAIPTRRTHFTVISGPHVHKTAREQFARTTHTRVIQVGTNNLSELNWLLESIKMYKFVGVELSMRITSSSFLLPTSTSQQDAAQQPLLAGHKQRFARLFGAQAPTSHAAHSSSSSSSSSSYAGLQQSLQDLRSELHQGLLQQRAALSATGRYERWQSTQDGQEAAREAAAVTAATGLTGAVKLPGQRLQDAVAQQLEGSSLVAPAADDAACSSSVTGNGREQALLRAVDKVLAGLKTDVLDRHRLFPYMIAFYQPGKHQVSAAEWMQAMLMYGKHRQQEVEAGQQQAVVDSYQQYGQVSRALLLLMLQQWYRAADAESRKQLSLPDAKQVDTMLHT